MCSYLVFSTDKNQGEGTIIILAKISCTIYPQIYLNHKLGFAY